MKELRCSLADIHAASRRFKIKQFKDGDPYFIYYPDTTLIGSINLSDGEWKQIGGLGLSKEMIDVLGAHIDMNPEIGRE